MVATALAAVLTLSACEASSTTAPTSAATPSSTTPPLSAGPPSEAELSPGWADSPDGPAPTPDADLSDAALTAVLRTRSSSPNREESCGPAEVTARLSRVDAALGHRYTSLIVTNSSLRTCVVAGVPGVGARGEWGHRFTLTVERRVSPAGSTRPVRLAPGAEARALVEWTGELAGHDAERASLLVIQLASGQVPVRVPAHVTDAPAAVSDLDIGMLTTMRLGPFERRT